MPVPADSNKSKAQAPNEMTQLNKLEKIEKLVEEEAAPMGLSLVETRICQQGKRRSLEITICRKGGRVSLTDCEELSRKLDKRLDEEEPPLLDGAYNLEVQSPGLARQLKSRRDFELFQGELVELRCKRHFAPLGDCFLGYILSLANNTLTISNPRAISSEAKNKNSKKHKSSMQPSADTPGQISMDLNEIFSVRLHASSEPEETATTKYLQLNMERAHD